MRSVQPDELKELMARFDSVRVLVVGDVMMDEYVWGQVDRISPEAPVPVVHVQRESWVPGGAGNVVTNLRALGVSTDLLGLVVLTVDLDREIAAMLIKHHLAAVRGPGCSYSYSWFHDSI